MYPQAHQCSAILLAIFQQQNDRVVSANMHPREGAKNEITPRIAVILVVFVNGCYMEETESTIKSLSAL